MRSNLAIVRNDVSDTDERFEFCALEIRAALNEMVAALGFKHAGSIFDAIVSHYATLALGSCSLKAPASPWGKLIWDHLMEMAGLKSHAEALAEAKNIRDQFVRWPVVLSA